MTSCFLKVAGHHFIAHLLHGDFRHPTEFVFGLAGVPKQGFHFSGAEVARVDADDGLSGLDGWGFVTFNLLDNGDFFDALAFKTQGNA